MFLQMFVDENGNKVYTLKRMMPDGDKPTESAHPARFPSHNKNFKQKVSSRFSPDDKYSKQRVACKSRFKLLPSQQQPYKY